MRNVALLWAIAVVLSAIVVLPSSATAQGEGDPNSPGGERFLVFTNGDPDVSAAVRSAVHGYGGHVADDIRVAPDLVMIVVSVPQTAVADLAAIPGVREVVREVPPTPSNDIRPDEAGDLETSPSTCSSPDGTGHGLQD